MGSLSEERRDKFEKSMRIYKEKYAPKPLVTLQAQESLAKHLGPVIQQIMSAGVSTKEASSAMSNLFKHFEEDEDVPSFPMDLYHDPLSKKLKKAKEIYDKKYKPPEVIRSDPKNKAGFFGKLEEGRVCVDGRAISGIIV